MSKLPKGFKKHKKYEPLNIGFMGYSNEILCPHGVGHDTGIHGCDGCCGALREYWGLKPVERVSEKTRQTGKSYFDLPDKEEKQIMNKAAKDSNKAQRELMYQPSKGTWEEWVDLFYVGDITGEQLVAEIKTQLANQESKVKERIRNETEKLEIPDRIQLDGTSGAYNKALSDALKIVEGQAE